MEDHKNKRVAKWALHKYMKRKVNFPWNEGGVRRKMGMRAGVERRKRSARGVADYHTECDS
jgi:hypothetical protein